MLIFKLVCLFTAALPNGCIAYPGPHSLACLNSTWLDVGCLSDGSGFPGKLSSGEFATLASKNFE